MFNQFMYLVITLPPIQEASILDTILSILAALIGGGLVTYIFDRVRDHKRTEAIKMLIMDEIKLNLKALESKDIEEKPWITHVTWRSFYDSNSVELATLKSTETRSNIFEFYSHLETLSRRDKDDEEIKRLRSEGNYNGADSLEKQVGKSKQDIRDTLIELAHKIIDKDDRPGKSKKI